MKLNKIINSTIVNIIVLIAILAASVTTIIVPQIVKAASWYDTDWGYRKTINVTNASADYQTKITVYYGAGVDASNTVYLNSHCNTDFSDIRFTGSDGYTSLDYWIETKTDSNNAVVWVQNNGTPDTVLYIYYGNAAVTTTSNGTTTFIVFDDFERGVDGDTIGGAWTEGTAHVHISTDQNFTTLTSTGVAGTRSAKLVGAAAAAYATLPITFSTSIAINYRIYKETASVASTLFGTATKDWELRFHTDEVVYYSNNVPAWTTTTRSINADAWNVIEEREWGLVGDTANVTVNAAVGTFGDATDNGAAENKLWIYGGDSLTGAASGASNDTWIDNVFVRKWASTEQSFSAWGAEESAPDVPTTVTYNATSIGITSATLNGGITAVGADAPGNRGFVWGTTSNTTKPSYNEAPPASYDSSYTSNGTFATGNFTYSGGTYLGETTYYFRAWSQNSEGYSYGTELSFTTIPLSTYVTLANAKVFRSYIDTGDWLITYLCTNLCEPYYSNGDDVNRYFYAQLYDTTGTTLLAQTKCSAWGMRPGAIYLSSTAVTPLTWGSAYIVRIATTADPATYVEYTLQASDWMGDNLILLDSWTRSAAILIENYYGVSLTEYVSGKGLTLDEDGCVIFSDGIPELEKVRPGLFMIVSNSTAQAERMFTQANRPVWQTMWGPYISAALTQFGNTFNANGQTAGALLGFLFYAIIAAVAFPQGSAAAAIGIPFVIMIGVFATGLISMAMLGVILSIAAFILIFQMWLKVS